MRILQLCNKVPYPAKDGGALAILNMSVAFAEGNHQVTVLTMSTSKHPANVQSMPVKIASKIRFLSVEVDTQIRIWTLIRNLLFSRMPYTVERFISNDYAKALENLLTLNTFDIIQLEGLYLANYLPVIRRYSEAKISYRAHNIEHKIWSRMHNKTLNPLKAAYLKILTRRITRYEKAFINKYDLLVPITEKDFTHFQILGNDKPSMVIPFGIAEDYFQNAIDSDEPDSLFFIGSLDWVPNIQGINWFIDEVWKKLKLRNSKLSFHIAGRNAAKWFEKKCHDNEIEFHGEIDDAKLFFDQYQVMVVPLFAGSGLRVKIIEAFARSKIVVATSIAAEGLDYENGKHMLIANTSDDFIEVIEKLIGSKDFYRKLEENSLTLAKEKYNSTKLANELLQFYSRQLC